MFAAVLAGVLLTLSFPGYGMWWLAPFAFTVLTLGTYAVGARRGFGFGLVAGLAFFVPTLSWAGTDFLGVVPWLGLASAESLYVGGFAALCGWVQRDRIRPVVVAAAWVAQEFLRSNTPYGGFPWVRVAFSQAESPFGRLAALVGVPGVGFVVALAGALLAWAALTAYRERSHGGWGAKRGRVVVALLGVVALVGIGWVVPLPIDGAATRVLAVQGNVPRAGLDFNAERRAVLDLHVEGTVRAVQTRAADAGPLDLIVWPENSSDIDPTRNPDAAEQIMRAVDTADVPVLLGGLLSEPAPKVSNASLLYLPGAGLVQRYVKQHPVPFAEYIPDREFFRHLSDSVDLLTRDMAAGDGPGIFRVPAHTGGEVVAGVSICFEIAYDGLVRTNVTEGANLLVVQTNNATFGWSHESVQQLAISRIRAIEHGRSVVHVSTVGVSALVLPDGTLLHPTTLFTAAALEDELPLRTDRTVATQLGAWPEYSALIVLLVLLLAGWIRHRKD